MQRQLARYGFAVLLGLVATGYGRILHPLVDDAITLLFLLAVILSAAVGGVGPGLLAALLSTAAVDYFFLLPLQSLRVLAAADLVLLTLYAGVAIASAGVVGVLRQWWAEHQLRAYRAEGMVKFLDHQLTDREEEVRAHELLRSGTGRHSRYGPSSS